MIEIILLLIVSFVAIIFFLPFIALFAIALIRLFKPQKDMPKQGATFQEQNEKKQVIDDFIKDSEGDGLVLLDEPMFPPEFEED
jgi:hypothetical protein